MKKLMPIFIGICLSLLLVSHTSWAVSYTFTNITHPNATFFFGTYASGINNRGHLVGGYNNGYGYLIDNGVFININDYPGASHMGYGSGAHDINNKGQIVGGYEDDVTYHGYVLDSKVFSPIDYPGASETYTQGINDSGYIVGWYRDKEWIAHGFIKDETGFSAIDFPGALETYTNGINNSGQIVGWYMDTEGLTHGFLKNGTAFSSIDFPDTVIYTYAFGINNKGEIVGGYWGENWYGYLLKGGVFSTIDIELFKGGYGGFAYDINDYLRTNCR